MVRERAGGWWLVWLLVCWLPCAGTAGDGTLRTVRLRAQATDHPYGLLDRGFRLRSRTGTNRTHDNHYLFGPSAIPLEGGTGYYQNQDILLHSAYYAPVEGLSIGAGVQAWSLITLKAEGSHGPMVHCRLNASGEVGNSFHAGGFLMGVRMGNDYELSDQVRIPTTLGLAGAQATVGTDPVNITITIGTTLYDGGFSEGPLLGLAGLWHLSDKVALITENWHVPLGKGEYRVYSYGMRYTHRTMAFDAAFAVNEELRDVFVLGLPILGFSLQL